MPSATRKIFNSQLLNFTNVISERFPNVKELKIASTGLSTLNKINPKKPLEMFLQYTYKYRQQILDRDEQGLLSADINSDLKNNSLEVDDESANQLIITLRSHWIELSTEEKENIWKYFEVLIKLADKYLQEALEKKERKGL
jgi:hypothetical protein